MLPDDGETEGTCPTDESQHSDAEHRTAPHTEGTAERDDRATERNGSDNRWWIYRGTGQPLRDTGLKNVLPPPPPWRRFTGGPLASAPPSDDAEVERRLGRISALSAGPDQLRREADMVNAALLLRRPLLVTGRPGTGKSSLAYRISRELKLGRVLRWHITSRTTLRGGLYEYDAIGRVQDSAALRATHRADGRAAGDTSPRTADEEQLPGIGAYVQLGPLGTALLPHELPRVLLVDELDKSDQDLANDLLGVFEEGQFRIAELMRARRLHPRVTVMTEDPGRSAEIVDGIVTCRAFPVVVITSNGEREFPPAFLRRCLRLRMPDPDRSQLVAMVAAHLRQDASTPSEQARAEDLINQFLRNSRERGGLAIDQLLNSVFLATSGRFSGDEEALEDLVDALWHRLDGAGAESRTG
ncbi:AAA family ATPase [Streptomyces apricus]|uniref:MoxR family ATPase n=1 Tax=Streptomyces apricus TaxID=1828112 RepID=A0A5B0B2S8_9ACTN|nr:AAA family ATPase [Streptomyces apricus]KAA0935712.1 MoxR family ATPase [Streptomyces apricus]